MIIRHAAETSKGDVKMKVLLLNGSPDAKGCTYTAVTEVEITLQEAKFIR